MLIEKFLLVSIGVGLIEKRGESFNVGPACGEFTVGAKEKHGSLEKEVVVADGRGVAEIGISSRKNGVYERKLGDEVCAWGFLEKRSDTVIVGRLALFEKRMHFDQEIPVGRERRKKRGD